MERRRLAQISCPDIVGLEISKWSLLASRKTIVANMFSGMHSDETSRWISKETVGDNPCKSNGNRHHAGGVHVHQ
jgi:hypothetical protein